MKIGACRLGEPAQPRNGPNVLRAHPDRDWQDAQRRVPIFAGDVPKADKPLPKFLDDPTATKLMATLAADPDRRRRHWSTPASPTPTSLTSTSRPPRPSKPTPAPRRRRRTTKRQENIVGLLGNGHCTRPLELECRFQTIREGCRFYETSIEFVDVLTRQRDDATSHADAARAKLYDELVRVIDSSPA
jgi:hypothetical protein